MADRLMVRTLHFRLHPGWKKAPKAHPWSFNILGKDEVTSERLVHDVYITGVCYGGDLTLPDGRVTKAVICAESTLRFDGDTLHIHTKDVPPSREADIEKQYILVRLNTEWLKDHALSPWRVVVKRADDTFEERLAQSFKIFGHCFGTRHEFEEPVGPKMNVACFGVVQWDGEDAYINACE